MKHFKSAAVAVLASSGPALAQNATAETGPGPFPADQSAIFENADTPATKSVPFHLWYPSAEDAPAPTWTWTARVQEAPVEDSEVPNASRLNTVYDFAWGEGELSTAVAQNIAQLSPENFCVTVVASLFPAARTNNYDADTEENASDGSCSGPLRGRCLESIQRAFEESEPDANGCKGGNLDLSTIHQCQWTFEQTFQGATYNLLANSTADEAANDTFPLSSGSGFAHITSDVYDGSNRTFFDQADLRLHMVIIDSGNTFTPLCMRINSEESAGPGALNAAGGLSANWWMVGAAAVAALAYML